MGQAQNICACPIFTMLHLLHTNHTQPIITLKVCKCTPQTIFGLNSGGLQASSLLCHRMACIENRWVTLKGARRKMVPGAFTILQQLTGRVSYILHKHDATH